MPRYPFERAIMGAERLQHILLWDDELIINAPLQGHLETLQTLVVEFSLLDMFLLRCRVHKCFDNANLKDLFTKIWSIYKDAENVLPSAEVIDENICSYLSHVLETIESLKPEILEANVLIQSLYNIDHVMLKTETAVMEYVLYFSGMLKKLVCYEGNPVPVFRKQLEALEKDFRFQTGFMGFTLNTTLNNEWEWICLLDYIAVEVDKAVCLLFSAWCTLRVGYDIPMEMKIGFAEIQEWFKPTTPATRNIYLQLLKASIAPYRNHTEMNSFFTLFLDSLLQMLSEVLSCPADWLVIMADELKVFHNDLKQVQNFLIYTPKNCLQHDQANNIIRELEDIIIQAGFLIYSMYGDKTKADMPEEVTLSLYNWQEKVKQFEDKITQIYLETAKSCQSNYNADGLHFMESFIEKLDDLLTLEAYSTAPMKIAVETILEQLVLLEPFVQDISLERDAQKELNDLWALFLVKVCEAEHVTDLLLVKDSNTEDLTQSLMVSVEEIKIIKRKIIQVCSINKCDHSVRTAAEGSPQNIPKVNAHIMDEVPVRVEDETVKLIKTLVEGPSELGVISIASKAGLWKTTRARKLHGHETVVSWFDVRPWCQVSSKYQKKELLLELLGYTHKLNDEKEISSQELNARLRQRIKRTFDAFHLERPKVEMCDSPTIRAAIRGVKRLKCLLVRDEVNAPLKDQVETMILEFMFLDTFLLRCRVHKCSDNANLKDLLTSIQSIAGDAGNMLLSAKKADESICSYASHLLETIHSLKPEIVKANVLINQSLHNIYIKEIGTILIYLCAFLENLKKLACYEGNSAAIFKKEFEAFEKDSRFQTEFLNFTRGTCNDMTKWFALFAHIAVEVDRAVGLSFLAWCHIVDEDMAMEMKIDFSEIQEQFKPISPKAWEIYVGVLKVSTAPSRHKPWMDHLVTIFINSSLEKLSEVLSCNAQWLVFTADELIVFHKDLRQVENLSIYMPKNCLQHDKINDIFMELEDVIIQAEFLIYSLCDHKKKEDTPKEIICSISSWQEKVKQIEDEIAEIYLETGKSCQLNSSNAFGQRFIESFTGKLEDLLTVEADSTASMKVAVEAILEELVLLKPFLQDMSLKRDTPKELNDLCALFLVKACEAENAIDLIFVEDDSTEDLTRSLMESVEEIKIIKRKIIQVYSNNKCDLPAITVAEGFTQQIPEVNAPIMDEVPVGFEDETEKLIKKLVEGPPQLDVISIVGMAGLGKSTMARKLHGHETVVGRFDVRPWCQVSSKYDLKELLLELLGYTIELNDKIKEMSFQELNALLKKSLMGRRYLVVMDDIWDTSAWDDLRMPFPDDGNGSRIIITTRQAEVADYAKIHSTPHHLRFFTREESWELLEKSLFKGESSYQELKDVGMEIAEHCQGLPLLVVLLLGVLRNTEKTRERWEEVEKGTRSHITGEQKQYLDKIEFSYQNLPEQLKQCFLYLSAFTKAKEFSVRQLIWLWSAEGIVRKTGLENAEKIAEKYLHQLISRNLVLVSKKGAKGGVKACYLHALVNEFCLAKSKEDNFLCVIDGEDVAFSQSLKTWTRRLCICSKREEFLQLCPVMHLHSLLFSAINDGTMPPLSYKIPFFLSRYKLLRVLDIGSIRIGDSFAEIELLVHLRFLALLADVTCIPTSIAKLRNLETFILRGLKGAVLLPHTIWSMVKLTHLHVYPGVLNSKQESLVDYFKLDNLQTFSTPSLSHGGTMEKLISKLPNLQKLKCLFVFSNMEGRKGSMFPRLHFLTRLETLKVICSSHQVLPPCVFNFPAKLKKLTLSKFSLPWSEISAIAALPELEILKLHFKAFSGEDWDVNDDDFPNLKFLVLDDVKLVRWTSSDDAFPSLKQLVLRKCKQLEEIPSAFQCPSSLQTIDVEWSSHKAAELALEIPEILLNEYGESGPKVSILPPDWNSRPSL